MKTIDNIKELKQHLSEERGANKRIGFVPTMGALHDGHISLVHKCVNENDICVVSIFVNPTQFNDKNDLITYPRTLEHDLSLLESAGCDYVFTPDEKEMYPEPDKRFFDFGRVAEVMEGKYRPGHFNGVAQIVSKLFSIVEPGKAYFGEKDFQQIAVIKTMVKQLDQKVEIVPCPILREKDGLALSSRNVRLSPEQRQKAPLIARVLEESTNFANERSVQETIDFVCNSINKEDEMRVEYYEIVDSETLEPVNKWSDSNDPVGCITVYCGEVRLIDNIHYNKAF
ncbi:pantoate--beta-alanine ligase [Massilibacteroides sp.]|uniref:pantoate--beta-alanine ligase n=1 Tax=Massilibacteroides sp. TaxID=2034766 RepID=UPI0026329288|nr:pantoate--beta-alanine ligase [Massilibacteroides sp.]MDD4515999.1 pantoate--beta-alanine ligase [Massilibacteroides sp.]